jgi:hypothetical protein
MFSALFVRISRNLVISLSLSVVMPAAECESLNVEQPVRVDRYGDPLPWGAVARMGTARLRLDQGILAFTFWPDDRTLAACCRDGSVRFWERAIGRERRRLQIPLFSPRVPPMPG